MKKGTISQKSISLLLSALMVITMVPAFMFSSFAEGEISATTPVFVSGEWEHETDADGKGVHYVSMWVKNTNFIFMQTKDNESFTYSFEFWAMKNDGINTVNITNVSYSGMTLTNSAWTTLTSSIVGNSPVTSLPGSLGSGYSNQQTKNLAKWQYTAEFTGYGHEESEATFDASYSAGATGYNTSSYSLSGSNEAVNFSVTVIDLREVISELAQSKDVLANDTTLTDAMKQNISAVVNNIENNYTLDGTVAYTQDEIDALVAQLKAVTDADYSKYNEAVAKAEIVLNNERYSNESKATISALLANKDTVLSMTIGQQNLVDAAAAELLEAINTAVNAIPAMNGIDNTNTSGEGVFTFNSLKDDSTTDTVTITFAHSTIYMNIDELLSGMSQKYTIGTNFKNDFYAAAPVTNSLATTSQIAGVDNLFNFGNYFEYSTTATADEKIGSGSNDHSTFVSKPYDISGTTPLKTTGSGEKVYVGAYWRQKNASWFSGYEYFSTNSSEFEIDIDQPYFTLCVYDKAPLKAALEKAVTIQNNATNYNEFLALIDEAETVYGTRSVTQTQVEQLTNALNNFEFTYEIKATTVPESSGSVTTALVSGTDKGNNLYTAGSVVTIKAVAEPDYELVGWSDGTTDDEITVTVNDNISIEASFRFVPANYADLLIAIADIPQDTSIYSQETAQALAQALANANEVVEASYGKSMQSAVDAATIAVKEAVGNLVQVVFNPCDYSILDDVLALAGTMPAENDGRFTADAWTAYQTALENAQNIDRTLTDQYPENQQMIADAALTLSDAIVALGETENQIFADTTSLETAKDTAQTTFGDTNDGTYKDSVWIAYTDAIAKANELINNPPFNNADGRQAVADAQQAITDAVTALNNADNKNYADTTALVTAKDNAESAYGETNNGKFTDDVWKAYTDALEAAKSLIDNPPADNEEGRQAVADAQKALADAVAALEDPANQNGKVDTTDLETAKDNAESTYGDTNSGKFTDEAWNNYKDAVAKAEELINNPPYDDDNGVNQAVVDAAKQAIADAVAALEDPANQNFTVTVKDENGETIAEIYVDKSTDTTFGDIKDQITNPTPDADHKFTGWTDENGNPVTDSTAITGSTTLTPVFELVKITPNDNGNSIIVDRTTNTEYTYLIGINANSNTVADIKASLANDGIQIIITRDGNVLSDNDLVGTGCIVKCVSTADPSVVYEIATVILYGDVNGDGLIDSTDHNIIKGTFFGGSNALISGTVYYYAADITNDGYVDVFDYFEHDRQLSGSRPIDQTMVTYNK